MFPHCGVEFGQINWFQHQSDFGGEAAHFGAPVALFALWQKYRSLNEIDFRLRHPRLIRQGIVVLVGSHGLHGTKRRSIPYYGE